MSETPFIFDRQDNLIRVFMLPETVSGDFCFGGGHPTNFQMVDWFRPTETPKDHWEKGAIQAYIRQKKYYRPDRNYICLCRTGEAFLVDEPQENQNA